MSPNQSSAQLIEDFLSEFEELEFPIFNEKIAWTLGCSVREWALAASAPIAVDISTTTGTCLFHAAMKGATVDNDLWAKRKREVTLRFNEPSALVAERMKDMGVDPFAVGWLDSETHAVAGGAIPLRVTGAGIVAVISMSGLTKGSDHAELVKILRAFLVNNLADLA